MNRATHYKRAEELMDYVDSDAQFAPGARERCLVRAQIHATLATAPDNVYRQVIDEEARQIEAQMRKAEETLKAANGDKERY